MFVFDFSSVSAGSVDVEAFLQDIVFAAISKPEHLFFILAEPKLLSNAFQDFFSRPDFVALEQSMVESTDPSFPAPRYRRILKHIFVGSMFNSEDNPSLEHNLPWLMTVKYLRTFAYVNGKLDDDLNLEDLRPWSGDIPDHGDFDLFEGVSYEVGSYRYRDSDSAFRKSFRSLSLAVFSLNDDLDYKQARHLVAQADTASQKGVPNVLLSGGRHQELRRREDEHRYEPEEILSFLQRDLYLS
ncbi:hypothetical protein [Rhizobium sp. MHM7A]|uniref:hypothetical protein n=1 Tax=Rhizobium sp. MHM7A TaxID=2583233 RepID=UPI001105AD1A|nr:hypothetical protein [Rhizobium sp. MHM7A]TLX16821.1 hypothetical protein FFR93_05605 [Rhizobium sp. MHM7A]